MTYCDEMLLFAYPSVTIPEMLVTDQRDGDIMGSDSHANVPPPLTAIRRTARADEQDRVGGTGSCKDLFLHRARLVSCLVLGRSNDKGGGWGGEGASRRLPSTQGARCWWRGDVEERGRRDGDIWYRWTRARVYRERTQATGES